MLEGAEFKGDIWKRFDDGLHPLKKLRDYSEAERIHMRKHYFSIVFVRDPWERLISAWRSKFENPKNSPYWKPWADANDVSDFTSFIHVICDQPIDMMNEHWRPQVDICDFQNVSYTFIGRFEHLADDVVTLQQRFGWTLPFPKRINPAPPTNEVISAYYTPELLDRVEEKYAQDIQEFSYTKPLLQSGFLQQYS